MPIISAADLDFNGAEVMGLSEAVFESGFAKPEIEKFHNVVTGIVAKKQIAIMGRLNGLVGKGTNACSPTSGTNTVTNSQKFWNPEMISDRLEACWTDLKDTFFIWGLKKGIEKANLEATDFLVFVEELLVDAIWEAIYRFAWFGDTAADDIAGGGVLTNGTDPLYFNRINGFFKQIYAIVATTPARLTSGLTAKNGAATYALQQFDTTDTTNRLVSTTLQNMKYGADTRLRGNKNKIFLATQSVGDQYERELIAANISFTTERLENGMEVLKAAGIEVMIFDLWDRVIAEFYDNGTILFQPHRVFLIDPENTQVGTEGESSLTEVDVHYDKVTKKNYIDFAFSLDAKIVLDYLVQAAY